MRQTIRKLIDYSPRHVEDWSLQGLGMFRLYLSREFRLHVWVPDLAVPNVSTLHTHPWHFRSEIISGAITDRLFEQRGGFAPTTHMKRKIVCGPGGGPADVYPTEVALALIQEVTIPEEECYDLTADAIHESIPTPGCVTLIERTFREDTEHAFVFYPIGTEWVSAEPRAATAQEVETMRETALKAWR